eukprot:scaffold101894_cov31-Prasinocladus_malaysianus.AAC.1
MAFCAIHSSMHERRGACLALPCLAGVEHTAPALFGSNSVSSCFVPLTYDQLKSFCRYPKHNSGYSSPSGLCMMVALGHAAHYPAR